MKLYLMMFAATFGYVTLRAFQQRNVAYDSYTWVIPTCYGMAVLDVYVVATVAKAGWSFPLVVTNGTAALLGCYFAMWFHKRFVKR